MNGWTQQSKLVANDGDDGDDFGRSVAVSVDGTTAVVGAVGDEDPNGSYTGSAYVFEQQGDTWSQQAKIAPDDGNEPDNFGDAVAVSRDGTTVLIGAHRDEEPNGQDAGSAYVFTRSNDSWNQQAKLAASDGDSGDSFGKAVALSGDGGTALISAFRDDEPVGENRGSAYVFRQSRSTWSQQVKLTGDESDRGDAFGRVVAMSEDGTTAVIGSTFADDPNRGGSAYIFDQSSGSWSRESRLAIDDGEQSDRFGYSLAVSRDGTTVLIGASGEGRNAGSAYVFNLSDSTWSQQSKLTANDSDNDDVFGREVAVSQDGTTAIICAPWDEDPADYNWGDKAGSAYLFEASGGSWSQQAKLVAEDGQRNDYFGSSVAVSGNGSTALIGAYGDKNAFDEETGSAYVFESA